ncbi:MAG: HAD-IC family P-type ATPase [Ignavibacteria bacterium]
MNQISGLTNNEVTARIKSGLTNTDIKPKTKTYSEILIENIFSLFNLIILGVIAFVIISYVINKDFKLLLDAIGIATIGIVNTSIAIYQEVQAKKALDKVNLLLKKQVTVIRDSRTEVIDIADIVKDDIIHINRGDQVIVDGEIIFSNRLEIDESLLTGESVPVEKKTGDEVLSGSFCLNGNGYYRAVRVGRECYAYKITNLAKKFKFVLTPLQKKINFILKTLFTISVFLVILKLLYVNTNIFSETNTATVREIATILISLVPQGLVLMSSVTFALGVYRISKLGAIVQRLNAIESFSNVQVVCMDKTGTLTENRLSVAKKVIIKPLVGNSDVISLLGSYAKLSSDKNATIQAIDNDCQSELDIKIISELPFNSNIKLSIQEVEFEDKRDFLILGGYDVLIEKVSINSRKIVEKLFEENELKYYRTLLFGKVTNIHTTDLKEEELSEIIIEPFVIVSISDTVRTDVIEAIQLFERNGVKIKILTGDSIYPVLSILDKINWKIDAGQIITGTELNSLNENEFREAVRQKIIFARLKPDHKLKIIDYLRRDKLYTAMIGDGVNDLPAIKHADLGIAMEEGSQITKEVADIVLLKNRFSLLPKVFDEGNKIVSSVNAISKLFLTKNFIVIYIFFLQFFLNLPFPLTPRRVSLINIFAIGLPSLMLVLKNKETKKIKRFAVDVFSYVLISATVIILFGYLSYFVAKVLFSVDAMQLDMIIVTTIIVIAISNFIIIAIQMNEFRSGYAIYGALLVAIYVLLATISSKITFLNYIKIFYEIEYISLKLWWIVSLASTAGIISLVFAQMLRTRILKIY